MWKFLENRLFFRADMAGLGKYNTGGYGRIGVYRVKVKVRVRVRVRVKVRVRVRVRVRQ